MSSFTWRARAAAVVAVLAGLLIATGSIALATDGTDHLTTDQTLLPGASLKSANGQYTLVQQRDGNLVQLRGTSPVWSTATSGIPGASIVLQSDGNLVTYDGSHRAVFQTHTLGSGANRLVVQNDGNVVLYATSKAVWSSRDGKLSTGPIGDDYPVRWRNPAPDTVVDSWGYYNRECTSFVAARLTSKNGYTMPRAIGNASEWDSYFRGRIDSTPRVGSIAQTDAGAGHVAWVAAVGNGTVTIEEYNGNTRYGYGTRTVSTGSFRYIHVKDL